MAGEQPAFHAQHVEKRVEEQYMWVSTETSKARARVKRRRRTVIQEEHENKQRRESDGQSLCDAARTCSRQQTSTRWVVDDQQNGQSRAIACGPTVGERVMPTTDKVHETGRRASSWCRRLTKFRTAEAPRGVDSLTFDVRGNRLAPELGMFYGFKRKESNCNAGAYQL